MSSGPNNPVQDIMIDGFIDPPADFAAIYAAHSSGMTPETLDLFVGAPRRRIGASLTFATALPPANTVIPHGEHSFMVMSPNLPISSRVLAHELGHIFLNAPDFPSQQPDTVFFPAGTTGLVPGGDTRINAWRRITLGTMNQARTVRAAGALSAPGNSILKEP